MKRDGTLVVVVIPIYKIELSWYETISLKRCFNILNSYELVFICSKNLDLQWYKKKYYNNDRVSFQFFDSKYFEDLQGYNQLLISSKFYKRFLAYEFLLIYQLDSYIFFDNLKYWCNQKYDYIGAPWIDVEWLNNIKIRSKHDILSDSNFFKRIFFRIKWTINRKSLNVGNGGLSLRKISSCYNVSRNLDSNYSWIGNEDVFWSVYVPLKSNFKTPSAKKALRFSFDNNPQTAFTASSQKLPMACHAWYRSDPPYESNFNFWRKFINPVS